MDSLTYKGWKIYFHPTFFEQYEELISVANKLELKLASDKLEQHPQIKLLHSIKRLIQEIMPMDPFASYFRLNNQLLKYKRVKKLGLPSRYRLFFRPILIDDEKIIIILWLGYPRKEGDKNDCYYNFTKMVKNGKIPDSIEDLVKISLPIVTL